MQNIFKIYFLPYFNIYLLPCGKELFNSVIAIKKGIKNCVMHSQSNEWRGLRESVIRNYQQQQQGSSEQSICEFNNHYFRLPTLRELPQ